MLRHRYNESTQTNTLFIVYYPTVKQACNSLHRNVKISLQRNNGKFLNQQKYIVGKRSKKLSHETSLC